MSDYEGMSFRTLVEMAYTDRTWDAPTKARIEMEIRYFNLAMEERDNQRKIIKFLEQIRDNTERGSL